MMFCMSCGCRLTKRWIQSDLRDRDVCPACSTVHYDNPKVVVSCICYWEQRILLCKRGIEPGKGLWDVPRGFVESGETLEEAATRELFEEVGLEVKPSELALFRIASAPFLNQIFIAFRAQLKSEPNLRIGPETLDARLFDVSEIDVRELAFVDSRSYDYPFDFFRYMRTGDFPVFAITISKSLSGDQPTT